MRLIAVFFIWMCLLCLIKSRSLEGEHEPTVNKVLKNEKCERQLLNYINECVSPLKVQHVNHHDIELDSMESLINQLNRIFYQIVFLNQKNSAVKEKNVFGSSIASEEGTPMYPTELRTSQGDQHASKGLVCVNCPENLQASKGSSRCRCNECFYRTLYHFLQEKKSKKRASREVEQLVSDILSQFGRNCGLVEGEPVVQEGQNYDFHGRTLTKRETKMSSYTDFKNVVLGLKL